MKEWVEKFHPVTLEPDDNGLDFKITQLDSGTIIAEQFDVKKDQLHQVPHGDVNQDQEKKSIWQKLIFWR